MLNLHKLKKDVIRDQFLALAKPLKSQPDDSMITASVVDMRGVDSTGEEGSEEGERSTAVMLQFMLQQIQNSDFQLY